MTIIPLENFHALRRQELVTGVMLELDEAYCSDERLGVGQLAEKFVHMMQQVLPDWPKPRFRVKAYNEPQVSKSILKPELQRTVEAAQAKYGLSAIY